MSCTIQAEPHIIGDPINKPPISKAASLANTAHTSPLKPPSNQSPFFDRGAASALTIVKPRRDIPETLTSWTVEMGVSDLPLPGTEVMARGDQERPRKQVMPENIPLLESSPGNVRDTKPNLMTPKAGSYAAPVIPPRLHHPGEDAIQTREKQLGAHSTRLIDISPMQTPAVTLGTSSRPNRAVEFQVEVDPSSDWSNVLIEDMETIGQSPKGRLKPMASGAGAEAAGSVCIRTTTTIGSAHSPPGHAQATVTPRLGTAPDASSDHLVTLTSARPIGSDKNYANSGSGERAGPAGNDFSLLDSPPQLPPNIWPSLTSPSHQKKKGSGLATTAALPDSATTSAHQLTPTKTRCVKICRRASADVLVAGASTKRDGLGMESADATKKLRAGVYPSDSPSLVVTMRLLRPANSSPAVGSPGGQLRSDQGQINDLIAKGAARQAVVEYDPDRAAKARAWRLRAEADAMSVSSRVQHRWKRTLLDRPDVDHPCRGGPKIQKVRLSNVTESRDPGGGELQVTSQDSPQDLPEEDTERRPKRPLEIMVRLFWAYWGIVRPVFDATSPISRRYARNQSTWVDCVVYLLALGFVLLIVLAGAWTIRCFLIVVGIVKALVTGFARLVDV